MSARRPRRTVGQVRRLAARALVLLSFAAAPAAGEPEADGRPGVRPSAAAPWPGERTASDRRILSFADLDGWAEDDHGAALAAFRGTCARLGGPDWPGLCALAQGLSPEAARSFFEAAFRPVLTSDGRAPLLTGYYEPEIEGSRRRTAGFRHPLYARPPELPDGRPWLTRREIEAGALAGRGLEIAWVADPVEALFLGIQGSGRVRLAEGGTLRLGFGGANGHERRSIGLEMVRRGLIEPFEASAATIRDWVRANPARGRELLRHDPSYVFFREVEGVGDDQGPLGAMLRPLTPLRSVAVDPAHVPLGAPVWVEKGGAEPMRRLMVAQDTGSAIRGPQRADLFFGTGDDAGRRAGAVRDRGRIVTLLPIRMAHALAPDPMGPREAAEDAWAASAGPPRRSPTPRARPMPTAGAVPTAPAEDDVRAAEEGVALSRSGADPSRAFGAGAARPEPPASDLSSEPPWEERPPRASGEASLDAPRWGASQAAAPSVPSPPVARRPEPRSPSSEPARADAAASFSASLPPPAAESAAPVAGAGAVPEDPPSGGEVRP